MRRRKFIAVFGLTAVWPLLTSAQERRLLPRIGLLLANQGPARDAILQSLSARGYVDGKTIKIEQRHAEGQLDRLPAWRENSSRSLLT